MEYRTLKKYGYRFPATLDQEIARRKESPCAIHLAFDEGQYFYLITPEVLSVTEEITTNEFRVLPELLTPLPERTQRLALRALLVAEIQATHRIEGIHSTRREIEEAMLPSGSSQQRFRQFIDILQTVLTRPHDYTIRTLEDIRSLYDHVTAGELNSSDAPDGILFRQGPVRIYSDSQKILHTGFQPEEKIHRGLQEMLTEALHPTTTRLVAAALCHFMFETVHPFYDGNGRTGRVLFAYHLKHDLSLLTVMSLSQAIAAEKSAYYEALKEARDPRNHGELTHLILTMLGFIVSAQNRLIEQMHAISRQIQILHQMASGVKIGQTPKMRHYAQTILQIVGEHYTAGTDIGISLDTLEEELGQTSSRRTISSVCDLLIGDGWLRETKRRPRMFTLSREGAQRLGLR